MWLKQIYVFYILRKKYYYAVLRVIIYIHMNIKLTRYNYYLYKKFRKNYSGIQ